MDDKHRLIWRRHKSILRKDLDPIRILGGLVEIFEESDEAEIKAQPTREKRCDKLIEIVLTKGPTAYEVFEEALKKYAPKHLALPSIEAGNKEKPNQLSALRDRSIN